MNASANGADTRVYRGRSIKEILPRIRTELGADAVVLAHREGLAGGVAGFFQQPFVEIEARAGGHASFDAYDTEDAAQFTPDLPAPPPAPGHTDHTAPTQAAQPPAAPQAGSHAAPNGGCSAAPQAGAYAAPNGPAPAVPHGVAAYAAPSGAAQPAAFDAPVQADPVAHGPVDHAAPGGADHAALEAAFAEHLSAAAAGQVARAVAAAAAQPAAEPAADAEPVPGRPRGADALAERMTAAGIAAELAEEVVAETVSHTMPFGTPRQLKRLVRGALARRIAVAPSFHGRRRAVAIVGGGGAGKTLSAARLAAAYVTGSDLPVRLIALEATPGGADVPAALGELGVEVHIAADAGAAAARVHPAGGEGLTVVDTPAVSPNDRERIATLAEQLGAMELDEVHVALPAYLSRSAAQDLLDALAPLGVSRVLLTHTDETTHVGPVIALAIDRGLPFSYVGRGDELPGGLLPADAYDLATRVLP